MPEGARAAWKATMLTTIGASTASDSGTKRLASRSAPVATSIPLSSGKK
jgi:hypothetical protein